jgi:superfamily II DNA or RNA helicase/HKD family nuclease
MTEDFSLRPIIDNQGTELRSEYRKVFRRCEEARLATGYFYVSGFNLYRDELDNLKSPEELGRAPIRILMGRETDRFTVEEIQEGMNLRDEVEKAVDEDIDELNNAQMERLERLKDFIGEGVVEIRIKTPDQGMFHAKGAAFRMPKPEDHYEGDNRPCATIVGSSNFSKSGHTKNIELNLATREDRETEAFEDWFDSQWTDNAQEFSEELVDIIESNKQYQDWKQDGGGSGGTDGPEPEFGTKIEPFEFYKLLAYDALNGHVGERFDSPLYHFQHIGYVSAKEKLARYNGCIISDSVGLGKSFIGAELLRDYRDRNQNCLLVVPAHLTDQWENLLQNETDEQGNPYFGLEVDGEHIEIMSITKFQMLEREEVEGMRDRFDTVLIDEAHRFRNSGHWKPDGDDIKGTRRYANMKWLQRDEPKTMIMLTATPVNNSAEDLKNLINLFTGENEIRNISGLDFDSFDEYIDLAAERKKMLREASADQAEIDRIVDQLNDESKEIGNILDEVMVLRTRKDVKEQLKDQEDFDMNFNPPKVYKKNYELPAAYEPAYEILPDVMNALHLSHITIRNPQGGGTLKALYKLNLLKRLESSPKSFIESLRTLYNSQTLLLETLRKLPDDQKIRSLQETEEESNLEDFTQNDEAAEELHEALEDLGLDETIVREGDEINDDLAQATVEDVKNFIYEDFIMLSKFVSMFASGIAPENHELIEKTHDVKNWLRRNDFNSIPDADGDMYDERVFPGRDVDDSLDKLEGFYQSIFSISEFKDTKVELLRDTLNDIEGKAVVFTQYKATADYIYDYLVNDPDSPLSQSNSAVIKGGDSNKREIVKRFSPGSAGYQSVLDEEGVSEIDFVVATDTLSEGVNLQDVNTAINYDLPYNPMRIVQRVGRIDRIGTEEDKQVFNFFPDEDLEAAIKLLERLRAKIDDIAMIVGKENNILDPNEDKVLDRAGVEKEKKIGEIELDEIKETVENSRSTEDINELDDVTQNKLLSQTDRSEKKAFEKIRLKKDLREDYNLTESDFEFAEEFFGEIPEDREIIYTVLPEHTFDEGNVLGLMHLWYQDKDSPLNRNEREIFYTESNSRVKSLNSVRQIEDLDKDQKELQDPPKEKIEKQLKQIEGKVEKRLEETKEKQLEGAYKQGEKKSKQQEMIVQYLEQKVIPERESTGKAERVLERLKNPNLRNTDEGRILRNLVREEETLVDWDVDELLEELEDFLDEYIEESTDYQTDLASKNEVRGNIQIWGFVE